jgi:hypothetical protein
LPELGQQLTLKAGDRLDLPAGTVHDAHVGAQGLPRSTWGLISRNPHLAENEETKRMHPVRTHPFQLLLTNYQTTRWNSASRAVPSL